MLFQDNRIYRIPEEIGQLSNLTELNITVNPVVRNIPAEKGQPT